MSLELLVLEHPHDAHLPFGTTRRGFNPSWWNSATGFFNRDSYDYLSFFRKGEEVARAQTMPSDQVHGEYIGLAKETRGVQIVFFEVREDCRGQDIGPQAIDLLRQQRYPDRTIFAYSKNADDFWTRTGGNRHYRVDGDTHFDPLFVFAPNVQSRQA